MSFLNNKKIFLAALITSVFILSAFLITVTADVNDDGYAYIIQPHKDTFAIYKSESKSPFYIFEGQKLEDLPDADRKSILNGLEIKDDEELEARIEDFES